ncbi:MAG: hypothetical protein ABN502_12105, partial [Gammaproteobacteria bacterium]
MAGILHRAWDRIAACRPDRSGAVTNAGNTFMPRTRAPGQARRKNARRNAMSRHFALAAAAVLLSACST